ncbi:hypothetical protein GCM10012275_33130 [Longimycelium tulufanense]|uniref:Uncharacterized protein n=1 Tax=Longimycelium tulufanense TaxID=907463 RepID=A0A8J3FX60_9PSEU|nr:hypothetical protein GCM10012275_33130 [Longimycelium tulufanense]
MTWRYSTFWTYRFATIGSGDAALAPEVGSRANAAATAAIAIPIERARMIVLSGIAGGAEWALRAFRAPARTFSCCRPWPVPDVSSTGQNGHPLTE